MTFDVLMFDEFMVIHVVVTHKGAGADSDWSWGLKCVRVLVHVKLPVERVQYQVE